MKANAKKLLALILAMVMSLSLAAPALAVGAELSTQAEKTEKPATATSLATATDATMAWKLTYDDETGAYTIYNTASAAQVSGNLLSSSQPSGVTRKVVQEAKHMIGFEPQAGIYSITYKGGTWENLKVGKDDGNKKSLLDVAASDWKDLEDGLTVDMPDGNKYLVKGSYYQEPQGNGLYKGFYKLYKADKDANTFKTSESPLYFVSAAAGELKTAKNFSDALAGAKQCDVYGDNTKTGDNIVDSKVVLATTRITDATTAYSFTYVNPSKGVSASGAVAAQFTDDTVSTGSFQVSIKADTTKDGNTTTAYITNVDEAKKILTDKWDVTTNAKLESVEAATGNYVTVNVSRIVTADPVATASDLWAKNVARYGAKNSPVLIDMSKDGWYKGTTKDGADANAIAANTEALGPVLVRASELTTGIHAKTNSAVGGFYVYDSVDEMKKDIEATDCKDAKTINYVQVIVNPWNGTKQNSLVNPVVKTTDPFTQDEAVTITLAKNYKTEAYNTPNADFVKKGTFDVPASAHKSKYEVKEVTTAATCQQPGVMTIKTICGDCKKVIETKTEPIAAITDPLEKKNGNQDEDPKSISFEGGAGHTSKHWIDKAETTTSVDAATGIITATTTYTCNFGHVHTEMDYVKTAKKDKLQNSGRWDNFTMEKVTAVELWAAGSAGSKSGLVKSVTVADTDVELTTFPINDSTGKTFKFYVGTNFASNLSTDGNYYGYDSKNGVEVYTSANGLPTTKNYAAKLTIKDIKAPTTQCEDASCTVVVDVYELAKGVTYNSIKTDFESKDADKFAKLLSDKKISLVKNHTEAVTIPGLGHKFFNNNGEATELCVRCGTKKPAETDATNDLSKATITIDPVKYAGTAMTEKDLNITVKLGNTTLARGIDYQVGELNIKAAGKYTVVIAGMNTYNGRQSVALTVTAQSTTAKKQTLKVSVAKKTYKVKNLKKKKASFTTKLSGAKTAVTWKSSNSKVTVKGSKTKATITVKKGTKKGTYKVTATAKKTSAYKKGTVTVKVIVK